MSADRIRIEPFSTVTIDGRPTIMLSIFNDGPNDFRAVGATWVHHYNTQPLTIGSSDGEVIPLCATEDSMSCNLPAGERLDFYFASYSLKDAISAAAVLSTERFWIQVTAKGREIGRVDGEKIGELLAKLDAELTNTES